MEEGGVLVSYPSSHHSVHFSYSNYLGKKTGIILRAVTGTQD